jgi:[NiFe] hydrogenase assembly HybE family chaperone
LLEQHYQQVWQTRMMDMPFVNDALKVEASGFVRHGGDWLGVIVTPWFLNLFLLNGGGSLWQDISAGQRRLVNLPCGALQFIADDDPELGLYQYCPLIAAVGTLADHATARQAALDALQAVLTIAVEPEPTEQAAPTSVVSGPGAWVAEGSAQVKEEPAQRAGDTEQNPLPPRLPDAKAASRRGFFRKLGGRA